MVAVVITYLCQPMDITFNHGFNHGSYIYDPMIIYIRISRSEVMINRDSWGHSYLTVRGEILGFVKDELLRKHLPRMFTLTLSKTIISSKT